MSGEPDQVLGQPDEAFYAALLDDDPTELYENAPCGYLSALLDGTIIKANGTFFAWTGYDRRDVIGRKRFQDLLAPGDRIFYETHFAPLLRMQGSVREIAVELRLADGRRLPVLTNAVLGRNADGEPHVIRTVIFDARERRSYEQELIAARRRAEASEATARALAETLQATLLPPLDLHIPGLDVAGAYRPAGDGSVVGGDFYDVFPTGRDTFAVVLGDVSGKGAAAAVVTALVRYSIRAEALRSASPSAVLRGVHEAMVRDQTDRFCTAVLLDVVPSPAGAEITVANAGHQRPVVTDGTDSWRVGFHGSIIGMVDQPDITDATVRLAPGEALVLYTDGVSEARSGEDFFDDHRAEALITDLAKADAATIAAGLADTAVAFQHGHTRDDIAVVAIKIPTPPD